MKNKLTYWLPYVLFVLLAVSFVKTIVDTYNANNRVHQLAANVDSLTQENLDLQKERDYRSTTAFAEQEARNKLSMIHPGDTVIVFSQPEEPISGVGATLTEAQRPSTIYQQWGKLLFPAW